MNLFARMFRRKPIRKVFLVMHDGRLVVAKAYETQAGWCASWIGENNISILLPGGKTFGTDLVKGWKPYSGWTLLEPVLLTTNLPPLFKEAETSQ